MVVEEEEDVKKVVAVESGGGVWSSLSTLVLVYVERDGKEKWALWDTQTRCVNISDDVPGSSFSNALEQCACVLCIDPVSKVNGIKPQLTLQLFCELYSELSGRQPSQL